ncbi:TadE/TadG family type IV pilus assembly protein [Nocardioides acrostichi]|uniref:Pilus assembly protein n=1 Tax=Nocardioides acrostichi TaxID=2784339 RepID=A0A930V0H6_9ACTN|nr:TadE/TadG family type IV pilus assembly protein [Nocardioides acrostichi]MBF4161774.1 pilus assembly protein [Nocardioides acrostichi]
MSPRRLRGERGVSTVELVIYAPLLMLVVLLVVQFAMVYLGNQAANAVARETARVVRSTHSKAAGESAGREYANSIGQGILEDYDIQVVSDGETVRVVVTGRAQEIVPGFAPRFSETVEGPIERFVSYS